VSEQTYLWFSWVVLNKGLLNGLQLLFHSSIVIIFQ